MIEVDDGRNSKKTVAQHCAALQFQEMARISRYSLFALSPETYNALENLYIKSRLDTDTNSPYASLSDQNIFAKLLDEIGELQVGYEYRLSLPHIFPAPISAPLPQSVEIWTRTPSLQPTEIRIPA